MKKVILILLCILAFAICASAQSYVPTEDVLGAHNNGGRGCAGCHQPHSGAGGAGSGAAATGTGAINNSGDDALFGQDLGPLYGQTFAFGDKGEFKLEMPANSSAIVGSEEVRGIMMCLACHDGSLAKGAMMQNSAYEQRMGLLPAGVYGSGTIPTLLGTDGRGTGYYNDHPVGKEATLASARLGTSNLNVTLSADGNSITSITPVASSKYANFVADYGYPAIAGTSWGWGVAVNEERKVGYLVDPTCDPYAPGANCATWTAFDKLYLTCTTCHNQHSMNVYKSLGSKSGIAGDGGSKTYRTYFFVNAPYNMGATAGMVTANGTTSFNNKASSATQFCRQCHFSTSNESYGLNLPTTF